MGMAPAETPAAAAGDVSTEGSHKTLAALVVGALGVVFGDIGTSPLYALNLMFFGYGNGPLAADDICGGISLVIWALTIVIAFKYAVLVLRADNDGEGGVFALYGLLDQARKRGMPPVMWLLLLGAGLLFGDGIITPAISVLSAVEGIAVARPELGFAVIPLTVLLLTALFAFQRRGTGGVGLVFGPVMIVWFVAIAVLGLMQIGQKPEILRAFNPLCGIEFLRHGNLHGALFVLASVMLVLTGGEAMFADLGHFGRLPIRISWFTIVYPSLLLSYLGQGAFLLQGLPRTEGSLFYSIVPTAWLYPVVVLATAATVIASQALISAVFSLTSQAIALGLFPRLSIRHTHHARAGEVYVPYVNWTLYVGCTLLVVVFRSSSELGAAYGLAVSGDMIITSIAMFYIAQRYWGWGILQSGALFGTLTLIDGTFLTANSLKFLEGGFIPLAIGAVMFGTMATWRWGRKVTYAGYSARHTMTMQQLIELHANATHYIERTAILMVPAPVHRASPRTPTLVQLLWDRSGILPRHIIFVQVVHPKVPFVHDNRYSVAVIERSADRSITRVELKFGFMEDPNVEAALEKMVSHKEIDLSIDRREWVVHVVNENLVPSPTMNRLRRIRLKIFKILRFISRPAYYHYGLADEVELTAEVLAIHVR
jgi:KUP system potassium uptake protein